MRTNATLGDFWGAETSPSGFDLVYAQTANEIAPGIVDYARTIQTIGESLIDAISRARMSLAMTDYQRSMLDVQLDRARQGLAPLPTNYGVGTGSQIDSKTVMLALAAIAFLILMTRKS